ncbi:MAG: protein translocase subunit SecF [Deltaproteobacteria bacterium]|nr:protein translocase subunit SecF [Deltaproteobacteria bacterium]
MKLFKQVPNFPFVKNRFIFMALSGLIVLASIFILATKGLNYGTDFTGGVKLQYKFDKAVTEDEIRNILSGLGLKEASVVRYGEAEENRFVIRLAKPTEENLTVSTTLTPAFAKALGESSITLEQEEVVGPKVGEELRKKGMLAVLVSLACMLIYIGFRFDFHFAPGALAALFHDVLLALGAFALLQLEFNLTVLAAILTIVGYSINDTIIVFDRIREHSKQIDPDSLEEVVNRSINETLSRTVITSLTVFFVVLTLYLFGGATIKDFAFAFMIGIITGTYSTFSIACPIYVSLYKWIPGRK